MNNLEHLHTIDFDLLEFGVIRRMSSLCNRYLSPFLVGRYRDALILKSLEFFIGALGFKAPFSLDQW